MPATRAPRKPKAVQPPAENLGTVKPPVEALDNQGQDKEMPEVKAEEAVSLDVQEVSAEIAEGLVTAGAIPSKRPTIMFVTVKASNPLDTVQSAGLGFSKNTVTLIADDDPRYPEIAAHARLVVTAKDPR